MYQFNLIRKFDSEYIIRCRKNGVRHPDGDYFTDDRDDAIATLRHLQKWASQNPDENCLRLYDPHEQMWYTPDGNQCTWTADVYDTDPDGKWHHETVRDLMLAGY
jgi:hypothetical protein